MPAPLFRQADAADFRIAIGAAGHVIVVDRPRFLPGNPLGGDDPFGGRHVRELRMPGRAERDHVADRGNARHVRPEQRVDLDVALLDLQSDAFGIQARGDRAAPGGDEQVVGANGLRRAIGKLRLRHRRRRCAALARVTFAPVWLVMPCFRNDFSSSAETASSSTGTRRGSSSTMVTSLPKRWKIDANSTPTAPLPMMTIDFGTSRRWIASSLVMMRLRSISMPGTPRGAEPVATMISLRARSVCCSPFEHVDAAVAGQSRGALDPVDLVLLEQELDALGQAVDDPVLARVDLRHVDASAAAPGRARCPTPWRAARS